MTEKINYYRIKQVDFNGKYEYSEVVIVENDKIESTVEVYPTRVREELRINSDQELSIRIYNGSGQFHQEYSNTESISMREYQSGIYFVQCITAQGELLEVKKIIKI